jgi:hypothetical protein
MAICAGLFPSPDLRGAWPPPPLSRWAYVGYTAVWLLYAAVLCNPSWPPFTWFDRSNLT